MVPAQHLKECKYCDASGRNCTSEEGGDGWQEGHLLVYVSLINTKECQESEEFVYNVSLNIISCGLCSVDYTRERLRDIMFLFCIVRYLDHL